MADRLGEYVGPCRGDERRAINDERLELCRRIGDAAGEAEVLCDQAWGRWFDGLLEEDADGERDSRRLLREQRQLCHRRGLTRGRALWADATAWLLFCDGWPGPMRRLFAMEEHLCRQCGDLGLLCVCLLERARILRVVPATRAKAWAKMEEAEMIARELGLALLVRAAVTDQGVAALVEGDERRSLALLRGVRARPAEGDSESSLEAALRQALEFPDDWERMVTESFAQEFARGAERVARELGDAGAVQWALGRLAIVPQGVGSGGCPRAVRRAGGDPARTRPWFGAGRDPSSEGRSPDPPEQAGGGLRCPQRGGRRLRRVRLDVASGWREKTAARCSPRRASRVRGYRHRSRRFSSSSSWSVGGWGTGPGRCGPCAIAHASSASSTPAPAPCRSSTRRSSIWTYDDALGTGGAMSEDSRRRTKVHQDALAEAESLYAEAERLRTAGRHTIAEGLTLVCAVDEQEASETYRRAGELFAAAGQGEEAADSFYRAAGLLDDEEARYTLLLKARALFAEAGRKDGEADCEFALGRLLAHMFGESTLGDGRYYIYQNCHPDRFENAVEYLDRARRLYADLGREDRVADCLYDAAYFLHRQLFEEEAIARYRDALELYFSQGRVCDAACCLGNLAWALRDFGGADEALDARARQVQLLEDHGRLQEAADRCRSLADGLRDAGREEDALVTLERALTLRRTAAERAWRVHVRGDQAVTARRLLVRLGYEQAGQDGDLPEELARAAHCVLGELDAASLYLDCANAYKALGRDTDARVCLGRLGRIADDVYSAACTAAREGRSEQAANGFAEAAWLYGEVGRSDRRDDCIRASVLVEGSMNLLEPEWADDIPTGELDQMRVLSEKQGCSPAAKALFLKEGLRRASRTRSLCGQMRRLFGDPEGALRLLTLAIEGFSEVGEDAKAAECQVEAARALASLGHWEQGRELLDAAKLAFVRLGAPEHDVEMCSACWMSGAGLASPRDERTMELKPPRELAGSGVRAAPAVDGRLLDAAARLLLKPESFARRWERDQYAVRWLWARLEEATNHRMIAAYTSAVDDPATAVLYGPGLPRLLRAGGHRPEACAVSAHQLRAARDADDLPALQEVVGVHAECALSAMRSLSSKSARRCAESWTTATVCSRRSGGSRPQSGVASSSPGRLPRTTARHCSRPNGAGSSARPATWTLVRTGWVRMRGASPSGTRAWRSAS